MTIPIPLGEGSEPDYLENVERQGMKQPAPIKDAPRPAPHFTKDEKKEQEYLEKQVKSGK